MQPWCSLVNTSPCHGEDRRFKSGRLRKYNIITAMVKITKDESEWRKALSPEEYRVLREKGTEPAFTGKYWDTHEKGVYHCAACGNELFSSETKFDSGTGWPSFYAPMSEDKVGTIRDKSYGMKRMEAVCSRCGSHLGHVFDDLPETYRSGRAGGPKPTGKRFCINSASLKLKKDKN